MGVPVFSPDGRLLMTLPYPYRQVREADIRCGMVMRVGLQSCFAAGRRLQEHSKLVWIDLIEDEKIICLDVESDNRQVLHTTRREMVDPSRFSTLFMVPLGTPYVGDLIERYQLNPDQAIVFAKMIASLQTEPWGERPPVSVFRLGQEHTHVLGMFMSFFNAGESYVMIDTDGTLRVYRHKQRGPSLDLNCAPGTWSLTPAGTSVWLCRSNSPGALIQLSAHMPTMDRRQQPTKRDYLSVFAN